MQYEELFQEKPKLVTKEFSPAIFKFHLQKKKLNCFSKFYFSYYIYHHPGELAMSRHVIFQRSTFKEIIFA